MRARAVLTKVAYTPSPPPWSSWDGRLLERGRFEALGEARVYQAASCLRRAMDSELAEVRALEAEIAVLRPACKEPPAPRGDAASVRYVALVWPGGASEGLSSWAFRTSRQMFPKHQTWVGTQVL